MIFNFNNDVNITHSFDDSVFNQLTTVPAITGDKLPTIYGSGYITIKRISSTGAAVDQVNAYIDDNTQPFKISSAVNSGLRGDLYTLFFQKSIRFENGISADTYFYQTLLADELIDDKYKITQGTTYKTDYTTFTGKGKIVIASYNSAPTMQYSVDNLSEQVYAFNRSQCMVYMFNENFKFKSINEYLLYYIAYVEK